MKYGIFIFRRDLRLIDNIALIKLQKEVDIIIPIFILDRYQINKTKHNKYYFSNNVVQFMCESLIDLNNSLIKYNSYLRLYYGNPIKIIKKLIKWVLQYSKNIYLAFNNDFSKYAINRDTNIRNICIKNNINIINSDDDLSLIPIELLKKSDGTGFKQYGAFYKNVIKYNVNKVHKYNFDNYLNKKIKTKSEFNIEHLNKFYKYNNNLAQNGGRTLCLQKIKNIKKFNNYDKYRNQLDYNTTNLSAYLNFGCISIREIYHIIKEKISSKELLKQLYWRDFYLQALINLDNAKEYKHMDERYNKIKWKNSESDWNKIINSKTGFLIIDAAMNEMKITGFMHNRARMIVGVFWTKYLLINIFHPKYGSQVGFSKYLVDAIGPSQNKMNHQWITEFDFPGKKFSPSHAPIAGRPMDPSNKMIKKWDPECKYIKKWLPQLENIPNKDLINWNEEIAKKYKIHVPPLFNAKDKYQEWIKLCSINK